MSISWNWISCFMILILLLCFISHLTQPFVVNGYIIAANVALDLYICIFIFCLVSTFKPLYFFFPPAIQQCNVFSVSNGLTYIIFSMHNNVLFVFWRVCFLCFMCFFLLFRRPLRKKHLFLPLSTRLPATGTVRRCRGPIIITSPFWFSLATRPFRLHRNQIYINIYIYTLRRLN